MTGHSRKAPDVSADLHSRLLTLDGHLDAPTHFSREGWSFGDLHDRANEIAQADLPRMANGNLDGGFFVVYTPQGPLTTEAYETAFAAALSRSREIDATVDAFSDIIGAARTADDAERLHREGRLIAFKSMENSYPVGEDLARVEEFHRHGVSLAGPVHSHGNQLADSATDVPRWGGLSPLGRDWVAEMNRLGMVIDPSHASDAAFDDMLAISKGPLLLSHSGSRTVFDTPRNLDDGRLRALADASGVICFTTIYLSAFHSPPERLSLLGQLSRIGTLSASEQADLTASWRELDRTEPMWDADLDSFIAGLLHVIDVAGIDHVAFGADFDGGGGIPGLEDVTDLPRITDRLIAAGFSEDDLAKLWSGNILRVLRANQALSR